MLPDDARRGLRAGEGENGAEGMSTFGRRSQTMSILSSVDVVVVVIVLLLVLLGVSNEEVREGGAPETVAT